MPVIAILRRLSQKDYGETWAILACRERDFGERGEWEEGEAF